MVIKVGLISGKYHEDKRCKILISKEDSVIGFETLSPRSHNGSGKLRSSTFNQYLKN